MVEINAFTGEMLCQLWDKIELETNPTTAQAETIQRVRHALDCATP